MFCISRSDDVRKMRKDTQRKINEIYQMIDDLREIITFKIDDNDNRDNAKRLLNCIEEAIKSLDKDKRNI